MNTSSPPEAPSLREACHFWWKLGWISFGGPAGQIALMHDELVTRRRWISEGRFLHALNYCMLLPGPEAQQLATYLGWLLHRTAGGLIAGLLFILPSLLILIALSWLYVTHQSSPWVAGAFAGIKPAVTALILHAAWRVATRSLKTPPLKLVALLSLVAGVGFSVPFPVIIGLATLTGFIGGHLQPDAFRQGAGHASAGHTAHAPAVLDDGTPLPEHARFRRGRLVMVIVVGVACLLMPMGALIALLGPEHLLPQLGRFFTQAALLTFGGAYAVLPYVVEGAVQTHGWLTTGQMMDGLALGETTPGPLIMIVTFAGFVAGWNQALTVGEPGLLLAIGAGGWVTWCTFLPSFVFILAGAPAIETARRQPALAAPLAAISAAVVGVIVELGLFFAGHVFWPTGATSGVWTGLDVKAVIIAAAAWVGLAHLKRSVMEVIAAAALAGLLLTLAASH